MPDDTGGTSSDGAIELRLSLRGTDLYDSFRFAVPSEYADATLTDVIAFVFPDEPEAFHKNYEALDVSANPDLPDIYLALSEVMETWRGGECALRFFTNRGPEIQPSEPVRDYLSIGNSSQARSASGPTLDLIVEQTFDVLAHFEGRGGDKDALLQWLQGMTLLYFIDKHGFQLRSDDPIETTSQLLPIAEDLQSRDILSLREASGVFEITEEGRRTLGEVIAETESYIDQFDLFKDVAYDQDAELVEFDNGDGADYRVQVYDAEGLDIYRTVFLLRMYDGTLDGYSNSWTEEIHSVDFFNEILRPVLDRERVDDETIDWIIDNGFAHKEEQLEAGKAGESQQEIIERVRRE